MRSGLRHALLSADETTDAATAEALNRRKSAEPGAVAEPGAKAKAAKRRAPAKATRKGKGR